MRICPTCRNTFPARGRATCPHDGARLVDAEELARADGDPLIGRTLAGRFKVLGRVGTGGMGTVYRAEQVGLGRPVALKILKKELGGDRETVARFHREAKAMSLIIHPNTVRVFDFGEDGDGHLYLAMELLEGELLTAWIEREGTPPVDEAVDVVREILRSLAEAHSKGLIHRDLKPDNIYLARVEGHARPMVKVLDFGIAKAFRDDQKIDQLETQAGTVFGTPRYMSPEQAQGKVLDHRSDLYSVGVLLFHLLTGQPPFLDEDAVVVMAKHIRDVPPPVRRVVPDRPVPRSLEKALARALAKEPDDRFPSADAFEAALTRSLIDVETEIQRARPSVLSLGGLPRVPLAIGGAVVALALVAAVVIATGGLREDVAEASAPAPVVVAAESRPAPAVEAPAELPAVVTLASDPVGAEIWQGDTSLGPTPRRFELRSDQALTFTLRAEGHEPSDVRLTSESPPTQTVTLRPRPQSRPATTPAAIAPPRPRPRRQDDSATSGPTRPASDPYERFD